MEMNVWENLPLTLKVDQVAEVLQISRVKAFQLANSQDFPSCRVGKRILVPRDALREWLNASCQK